MTGVGEENFRKPVLDALRADHDFVTTIEADKAEGVLTITAEKKPALVVIDKTVAGGDAAVLAKQCAPSPSQSSRSASVGTTARHPFPPDQMLSVQPLQWS